MAVSFASVNPQNLELTPVRVTFNGTDLGGTLGNAVISMKYNKAEMKMDQLGTTVVDRAVAGTEITITTELAEVLDKDIWKVVFPHATKAVSGGQEVIYWPSMVGDKDSARAHQLVLHPLSKVDADKSEDFLFYKAVASAESEITYGPEEQARLKIVWNVLPDTSTVPARFFLHGDPGVGLVAASGNLASYSGTGTGTVTGIAVYSGQTVTEAISVTCVTPQTNGGVFNVNGSLSGPLGLATVGMAFVSDVVSFTITDGGTDYALNDVFTINTVAANYA